MAKEAYYFSHDANAQDDPKCMILIDQLGMEGYGIFWALIEKLRSEPSYKLPLMIVASLAKRWGTSTEKVKTVIDRFGLFVVEDDLFFSLRLQRSMEEKSAKARLSASYRWIDANAMRSHSERNANGMRNDANKGKESKGKERKVKESKVEYPTQQQVVDFFAEKGYTKESALRAFDYYASNAWKDKNDKPVKNWKQKFISVWFKPENKMPDKKPVVIRPQDYWNRAEYLRDCEKHGIVPEVDEYAAR